MNMVHHHISGKNISLNYMETHVFRPSSEKFKGYNFVPTNYLEWQQYTVPKFGAILSGVCLALLSLVFLYTIISYSAPHIDYREGYYDEYNWWNKERWIVQDPLHLDAAYVYRYDIDEAIEDYHGELAPFFFVSLIFMAIFLTLLILSIKKMPRRVTASVPISEFADYVQKGYSGRVYSFFLKDGKMGLLNSKTLTVQLNPIYDKLKWKEVQRFIEAEMDGVSFVIDVNGNILK